MVSSRRYLVVALLALWALLIAYAALLATVLAAAAPAMAQQQTATQTANQNINIDDRDFEQTCNNVVNIILEDVQNPDVDNNPNATVNVSATQSADSSASSTLTVVSGNLSSTITTGDNTNTVAVEVSQDQIVDIAQELNVSPEIVQTCIQAGRDNIIVREGDRFVIVDRKFLEEKDIVKVEDHRRGRVAAERTDVLLHTVPRKPLPNTGGGSLVVWAGMIALVALYAALLAWRVRRRGW